MLRKVSPTVRRLVFSIVAFLALAGVLTVYQGRVIAMPRLPGGQPSVADLARVIEGLQAQVTMFTGDQVYAMGVESMRAVWQDHEEENVDATHPLTLNVYIPEDAKLIDRAFLRLKLLAFRSYSGTVASGGSSTATSASGGASTATSASGGGTTATSQTSSLWELVPGIYVPDAVSEKPDHTHTGATGETAGHTHTIAGDGNHTHALLADHQHDVTVPSHTHTVGIPNHTHTVAIPAHVHDVEHGIYEGTPADDVTVTINGTDRTVALGGAATGFTADQDSLDIMQYLQAGWNTIELGSSCLGRIQATYFVKAYLP